MIVAIDGPAASGKSTTARKVAAEVGFTYIDSGAMYRAITLNALRNGIDVNAMEKVAELARKTHLDFAFDNDTFFIYMDGEDVTEAIRLPEIAQNISPIAANSNVREVLVKRQREFAREHDVIMDGRDIGTVVFPNAELKIYLVASAEERAKRRMKELQSKGIPADFDEIKKEIIRRDKADMERAVGPLKKAPDAIELDTSNLTIEEQVQIIVDLIRQLKEKAGK
ncbi:MAG: (d)CMP kinase [Calditrichia bacterium]